MTSILQETLIDILADIKDNQLRLSRLERREFRQRHLNAGKKRDLTIAGGVLTIRSSDSNIRVDVQSGTTDDLDTISGGIEGQVLILSSAATARDTTLKDGTDNLILAGDFTLSSSSDSITLSRYITDVWIELSRSDNAV